MWCATPICWCFADAVLLLRKHLMASHKHSDYNEVIQFCAVGKLDVEALKMALTFLWRRHQVLRTALVLQVPQFPDLFLYLHSQPCQYLCGP